MIIKVNHGQVASGELPDSVIENDINPELSESDAHRYSTNTFKKKPLRMSFNTSFTIN